MKKKTQHILITGATGGLGGALAKMYAAPGVQLSLFGRNQDLMEQLITECHNKGAQVNVYYHEMTDYLHLQETVKQIDEHQPVDLIIANAGIAVYLDDHCNAEKWEDINHLLDVNLKGAISTILPLIDRMRQRFQGHIVLMSSLAAYRGMAVSPAYCASKAALKAYGEALHELLHHQGVKVSVICPGFIQSEMSNKFPASKPFMMTADKAAKIIHKQLQKGKSHIAFPFLLYLGMKILTVIPALFVDFFLYRLGFSVKKNM
ncbi:SDR family NAD(P)-dependent oxidoreductase [Legionella longbeachae]|uniref:SDR family NAD(P)-dependent oxidoreductase n=1 Tax=Legionella longbeachae TaxID=450 RepID=UPI001C1C5A2F|nr:SDR family NAD(P)-dependent oxidoreductase [Legionella pneumophila]